MNSAKEDTVLDTSFTITKADQTEKLNVQKTARALDDTTWYYECR